MTADVELLPLHLLEAFSQALKGERGELDAWLEVNNEADVRLHVDAYARACVARATVAKDAEIETLRAEVKDYRTNGAAAVRFAPSSAHWSKELRRLFGDDARTGIEVLENRHRQELARAERLAEALRMMVEMVEMDGFGKGAAMDTARAALHPTAEQADEAASLPAAGDFSSEVTP